MPKRRCPPSRPFPKILVLPIITAFLIFTWFLSISRPIDRQNNHRVNFTIAKGQSLDSIAQSLKEKKLIRSTHAFKIQVFISNLSTKIQAGDFAIPPNYNLGQVAESLTHGTSDRWVTLPEGWRREQIAQALVDVLSVDNPDYSFDPDRFLDLTKDLEGQLFPETYSLPRDTTTEQAIARLTEQFKLATTNLTNNSSLTDKQALVLASLIEREAITDSERPIIAGIILNRLNNNWPLQIDAAIQYAKSNTSCRLLTCDWWPKNITKADLEINSPFNTYNQTGLPPSPITNPSLASLKAAYNPTKSGYWFYLHDSAGNIHYAKTIEEHNANIAKYLQK